MKKISIKIRTLILLGFGIILFFVLVIGLIAYEQTSQLHAQTETMYNHPLQVRRAIGLLERDILEMRVGLRDLMLTDSDEVEDKILKQIDISSIDAENQFKLIYSTYLGPKLDVDSAYGAYRIWDEARIEYIEKALEGVDTDQIELAILDSGEVGILRGVMNEKIKVIDDFAKSKGDELFITSQQLYLDLNRQLINLISTIFLLSLLIGYIILQNIRKPLRIMNDAVTDFHNEDFDVRSEYKSKNEFGVLSNSINQLMDFVQKSNQLNSDSEQISKIMLSIEESNEFFRELLISLQKFTKSQMASIYLLDSESLKYNQLDAIGFNSDSIKTFSAKALEGEFGQVILTKKIQRVKLASDENRFVYKTTSGNYVPKELMTIPLISSNKIQGIISLANLEGFSDYSIELIERVVDTISARLEGVLSFNEIKEYRDSLESQNRELDRQKNELINQKFELNQQNVELEIQKNQITEASRLKTNFLSNMSHELRTPLNSVIALSGILNRRLEKLIPDEEYSYLEIIERNGKNLLLLINDILDISRIESGHIEVDLTLFNLSDLINEVVKLIAPIAHQKSVQLVNSNKIDELFITSDQMKCRHILQNIVGNAVKFTENGKVEISLKVNKDHINIHIIDEGIGISKENLKHIFDEFRQADAGTSRKYGGSGLGLAIAKKYTNMLGGEISVTSELNKGSTFDITLPIKMDNLTEDEKLYLNTNHVKDIKQNGISNGFVKGNILIVEDSESAVIQLKDLLQEINHNVTIARDAYEAFDQIDKQIPDAIILDIMMPEIDGFEVLKVIRNAEKTAHVPVLILTAKHISKDDLKFLKRNNVHQLIQKGDVNRIELQNAVQSMLRPMDKRSVEVNKEIVVNKSFKILVVEDNLDNLITTKALLDKEYFVIEAEDGLKAIELTNQYGPDLILMDIALPNLDGIEAFKRIRNSEHTANIPIIAISASAMTHEKEDILAHGFNGFISKPIIEQEFFLVINEVLYGK